MMKSTKYRKSDYLRLLALVPVTAFGLATIIASGGGGGGGDDDDEETPVSLLETYNYGLSSGFTIPPEPLRAEGEINGESVVLEVSHPAGAAPGINGTYNTITDATTVDTTSAILVNDLSTTTVLGDYLLEVKQVVQFPVFPTDSFATAGEILITPLVNNPVNDPVTVTIIDANPLDAVPDVRISSDAETSELTWQEYDALEDDPAATEVQLFTRFAMAPFEFMFEMLDLSINALQTIGDSSASLEFGPTVLTCDAFADEVLAAPAGVPDVGEMLVTWSDWNSSGEIDGGDGFSWQFSDCWQNDTGDNIDDLLNGMVFTGGYVEVENAGFITRIGFEPVAGVASGVTFQDFSIQETDSDTNPPTLGTTTVLSGGFKIVFSQ